MTLLLLIIFAFIAALLALHNQEDMERNGLFPACFMTVVAVGMILITLY